MCLRFRFTSLFWAAMFIALVQSLPESLCLADGERRKAAESTIRFDAILELKAPLLQTNIALFGRYWVAREHYSIAIIWAEPHESGLNFPTKPMTLIIDSNDRSFSIANQLHPGIRSVFTRPISERGVFRDKFNSYSLANIRFAEQEALASRIWRTDLKNIGSDTNDLWRKIELGRLSTQGHNARSVRNLDVRTSDGRVTDMKLIDAHGGLMKEVRYEYSDYNGETLLRRESVLLPESSLVVGYRGKGATITFNGQSRTYKELPALHHEGSREATIEHDILKTGETLLALPNNITVRSGDTKAVLRTAHMSDYVHLNLRPDEVRQAALQVGQFSPEEIRVHALFERYSPTANTRVPDEDTEEMRTLRQHFECSLPRGKPVGEQLRRVSMLLRLDWLQRHPALEKHFHQYLAVLTANGLDQMVLAAGTDIIDTTVWRHQFNEADNLMKDWLACAVAICDPIAALGFAESQVPRARYWIIARLLEKSLESDDWADARFKAQALRCNVLHKLTQPTEERDPARGAGYRTQLDWVVSSVGISKVAKELEDSLKEAQETFAHLTKPTDEQVALRAKLATIEKTVTTHDDAPQPDL